MSTGGLLANAVEEACVVGMSRSMTTTVRLGPEDAKALRKARADGHEASELIRRGLRIVAARYCTRKRKPALGLFVSVDPKLGDEAELFGDLEKK
jgi:Arc/MetJ-type ribon-helix-helix transcriptional regulator